MFDFHFVYADGTIYDVANINKVVFPTSSGLTTITNDNILSAQFPLKTMYLYGPGTNFTVSGDNLIIIDVLKHND